MGRTRGPYGGCGGASVAMLLPGALSSDVGRSVGDGVVAIPHFGASVLAES